jgi:hypothetical protein
VRRSLFDDLDSEWQVLSLSPAAGRACEKWAVGETSVATIVERAHRRGRPAESDALLAILVERAATDDLACRTVLQCLMPAMRATARHYAHTDHVSDVESAVLTETIDRIRNYPIARRPTSVAANIALDVRQVFWRTSAKSVDAWATDPSEMPHKVPVDRSAQDEVVGMLREGMRSGGMTQEEAKLIFATRIMDQPLDGLAIRHGVKPQTYRKRRQRAESKLAAVAIEV